MCVLHWLAYHTLDCSVALSIEYVCELMLKVTLDYCIDKLYIRRPLPIEHAVHVYHAVQYLMMHLGVISGCAYWMPMQNAQLQNLH